MRARIRQFGFASTKTTGPHPREEGIALVMAAALLVVLVGMVALAVDIGLLYSTRTTSQQIADAAALAGAFTFISDPLAPQPQTASVHATEIAVNNDIRATPIQPADLTISVDIPSQRVTVDVLTTQQNFFARVLGINTTDVGARGIAEAGSGASIGNCAKPWFVPNTIVSTAPPCDACAAGQTLIDPATRRVTPFARDSWGRQILVKPQDPHQTLGSGQFHVIDAGGEGGGANEYRALISTCAPQPVLCDDLLDVKTGNMVGPTRQGVENLIGNPPRDTYVDVGRYLVNGGVPSDISDGLVIAPIWDTCNFPGFCPQARFPSGTQTNIGVLGFALVFLEGFELGNEGNLMARLINVSACGTTRPGVTGSAVFSFPLRLVRLH